MARTVRCVLPTMMEFVPCLARREVPIVQAPAETIQSKRCRRNVLALSAVDRDRDNGQSHEVSGGIDHKLIVEENRHFYVEDGQVEPQGVGSRRCTNTVKRDS